MQPVSTTPTTSRKEGADELSKILAPGLVGFYNFLEVTEIVAFAEGAKTPINVLTVAVAEERTEESTEGYRFLNEARIELKTLKGWKFGVVRYCRPIEQFVAFLAEITDRQVWRASGHDLQLGSMTSLPSKFVPPDGLSAVALNRVLKNNFWNGSHVFEWADPKKDLLQPFFQEARRLQELSDAVNRHVPIGVGALSDRLGNILLQFPVTVMTAEFSSPRSNGGLVLKIGWHPMASPRNVMVTCERYSDGFLSASSAVRVSGPETHIPLASDEGHYRATVWDEAGTTLLAATGDSDFMSAIPIRMSIDSHRTRSFVIRDALGNETRYDIGIVDNQMMMVGAPYVDANGGFTRQRMYTEEISHLTEQRRFVQYATEAGESAAEKLRALSDLRRLINEHGEAGAWLWDPFLSAQDVLQTLFFCSHRNVDLRALTSGKEPPGMSSSEDFLARQRRIFAEAQSNLEGLRLEFRRKFGPKGSAFHDRFLIFPRSLDRATRVWSLGTSVNSVGLGHHILQQVDNGQAVMDAFLELWSALDGPEHLIWRVP
jgi:hypothetical protein